MKTERDEWSYIVSVDFCNDFLDCFLIPHIILLKGLLQLLHRNVPGIYESNIFLEKNSKRLKNQWKNYFGINTG